MPCNCGKRASEGRAWQPKAKRQAAPVPEGEPGPSHRIVNDERPVEQANGATPPRARQPTRA